MLIHTLKTHLLLPLQDFIYPPVCSTCDCLRTNRDSKVCDGCWGVIRRVEASQETWREIEGKFRDEGVVDEMLSYFLFEKDGKLQEIIHLLKYNSITSLGIELGKLIGRCMVMNTKFMSADVLVPVPLHRVKCRERGYNQSEFLCRGISEVTSIPVKTKFLTRKKYTLSQTELHLQERKENVGNAFKFNPNYVSAMAEKKIVLVDDVITTGSTINACAKELRKAGAASVLVASAALAK